MTSSDKKGIIILEAMIPDADGVLYTPEALERVAEESDDLYYEDGKLWMSRELFAQRLHEYDQQQIKNKQWH